MAFAADEAKLVSIFIQTLLYGAYTVVFILTCSVLLQNRPREEPPKIKLLSIVIVMFTLATMHICVNYTRIIQAFIIHRDAPGGPAAFFNELSQFTQLFGTTIYVAQTLVGDAVVLDRCYVVWQKQLYLVILPLLLLCGSTATGIGIIYTMARVVPTAPVFAAQLQSWITSFFSLTLATNVICTALVAARIWLVNRSVVRFAGHSFRPIILLVVESGAVYSATLIALLILFKAGSWFQFVLLDAISPIVGLVFSMIIVRIGLGITSVSGQTRVASTYAASSSVEGSSQRPRASPWFSHAPSDDGKKHVLSRIRFRSSTPGEATESSGMELEHSLEEREARLAAGQKGDVLPTASHDRESTLGGPPGPV